MKSVCKHFFSLSCLVLLIVINTVFAQDQAGNSNEDGKNIESAFDLDKAQFAKEWYALELEQEKQWQQLRDDIARKWQKVVVSSRRNWVAYDNKKVTRAIVDFKDGLIKIEAVILEKERDNQSRLIDNITSKLKKIFKRSDLDSRPILQNQVRNQKGQAIDETNLDRFIHQEVLPNIETDPSPFESKDGQIRRRYSAHIPMVKDHLQYRLQKYKPLIAANARRFKLPPELLAAVIHAESYFNPLAVSQAGAFGLMQVIPKFAGRESYQYLYGQDWTIRPEYLYSPGINMELGSAYLYLLSRRHFADIKDPVVNRYLSICGYNWGPTVLRRKVVNRYDFNRIQQGAALQLLQQKCPEETGKYLAKVVSRMETYANDFK